MRFLTLEPPPTLTSFVRELWLLEDDGALSAGLPKPNVELVVSLKGLHWWRSALEQPEHPFADAWVTPLQQGPRYARAEGGRRLVGARLEPWLATALFGLLPPGDGRPPPKLIDLIGPDAVSLRASLLGAADDADVFGRLATWLETNIASRATAISFCVNTLSERSARRKYARDVGVSPKRWLLLHRLDRVLRDPELTACDRSLAQLAHEHGFADQAHLNRELLRFTGATPGRLRGRDGKGPPHLLRQE